MGGEDALDSQDLPSMLSYCRDIDSYACVACAWVHGRRVRAFIPSSGTSLGNFEVHSILICVYALGCSVYLQGVYLWSHRALQVRASDMHISIHPLPDGVTLEPAGDQEQAL